MTALPFDLMDAEEATAAGPANDDTAVVPNDDTAVVPDVAPTAPAELAWSTETEPAIPPSAERKPLPLSLKLLLGAVVAAALVLGGFMWARPVSRPAVPPPTAKPVPPIAEKPPAWHLNGAYRMEIRYPEATFRDGVAGAVTSRTKPGLSTVTVWEAFETHCTAATDCTARTVALDDLTHQHADGSVPPALLRWTGAEWVSTAGPGLNGGRIWSISCGLGPGHLTMETWKTMSPLPDGSFRGTFHRAFVKDECGGGGLPGYEEDSPMVVVRLGDAPPGVFG